MKIHEVGVLDLATDPRGGLGDFVPGFFYRYVTLFAVSDSLGAKAKAALEQAGRRVGTELCGGMFYRTFADLAEHYRQHGMGILTVEEQGESYYKVRLSECVTCHGLPQVDMPLCWFDAGILAGAAQVMAGPSAAAQPPFKAVEVECAGLGNTSCLFEIRPTVEEVEEP